MSKIRLVSLLFALSMTALASFAKPPDPCSQYNYAHCIYRWDSESGCCVTSGALCIPRCP